MILRQLSDTEFKLVEVGIDEDQFVQNNTGFIKVEELPFSVAGYYLKQADNSFITDEAKDLEELKNQRMDEILNKFNDLMFSGTFESSLGFTADNRRGDGKDDKDNISSLIDLGQEPVYFRDHDNQFHSLTIAELTTLKQEMIQDGLGKYQWKWGKENEVMSAATIDELNAVII